MPRCKFSQRCKTFSERSSVCTETGGMYYGRDRPAGCYREKSALLVIGALLSFLFMASANATTSYSDTFDSNFNNFTIANGAFSVSSGYVLSGDNSVDPFGHLILNQTVMANATNVTISENVYVAAANSNQQAGIYLRWVNTTWYWKAWIQAYSGVQSLRLYYWNGSYNIIVINNTGPCGAIAASTWYILSFSAAGSSLNATLYWNNGTRMCEALTTNSFFATQAGQTGIFMRDASSRVDNYSITNNDAAGGSDTTPPTVTAVSPATGNTTTDSTVVFNCTVLDTASFISNVSFFENWTSAWNANETQTAPNTSLYNQTAFTKIVPNGTWIWGCKACDNQSNCAFSSNNTITKTNTADPTNSYSDTFDSDFNNWTVASGGFNIVSGTVNSTSASESDPFGQLIVNQTVLNNLTNATVSANVLVRPNYNTGPLSTNGGVGLFLRWYNSTNYMKGWIEAQNVSGPRIRILSWINGSYFELASVNCSIAFNTWYTLNFTSLGNVYNLTASNSSFYCQLSVIDGNYTAPGQVGIFGREEGMRADNFSVNVNTGGPADTTPPDISWNTPANNTFTLNSTSIYWNVTLSETPGTCYLNINGTANSSMTVDGNYCYLNTPSLTNLTEYCGRVYGSDSSGNFNLTSSRCVTINLTDGPPGNTAPDNYSDTFDSNFNNWTVGSGGFNIVSGTINSTAAAATDPFGQLIVNQTVLNNLTNATVSASVLVRQNGVSTNGGTGLLLRWYNSTNYMKAWIEAQTASGPRIRIFSWINGSYNELASVSCSLAFNTWYTLTFTSLGNVYNLTASNSTLYCQLSVTDSNYTTAGQVGIFAREEGMRADNFSAGIYNGTSGGGSTGTTLTLPSLGTTQKGVNYTIQAFYNDSGTPITGATCTLYSGFVEEFNSTLSYNSTTGAYEATHNMGVATGTHTYTIACSKSGYTSNQTSQTWTVESGTLGYADYGDRVEFANDNIMYYFNKTTYSSAEGGLVVRNLSDTWIRTFGLATDPERGGALQAVTSNCGYLSGRVPPVIIVNGTTITIDTAIIRGAANITVSWGGCYDNSGNEGWTNCYMMNLTIWSNNTFPYKYTVKKTVQVINGSFSQLTNGINEENWPTSTNTCFLALNKYPYPSPTTDTTLVGTHIYTDASGVKTYNDSGWGELSQHTMDNNTGGYYVIWNNRTNAGYPMAYIFTNSSNTGVLSIRVNYLGNGALGQTDNGFDETPVFIPDVDSSSNSLTSSSQFPTFYFVVMPNLGTQTDTDNDKIPDCFDGNNYCAYSGLNISQSFAQYASHFYLGGTLEGSDTTAPDITWNIPTNNTVTANTTLLGFNATVSETGGSAILNINATINYTMIWSGNYAYYTFNGANQTTYCGRVYANDSSGNLNLSSSRCITVNLYSSGSPSVIYNCSSCSECNARIASASPGDTVQLNTSITGYGGANDNTDSGETCIVFNGSITGVTFDCNGKTISGDGDFYGYGIWANSTNNITIKNCANVSYFARGIYLHGDNNTLSNSTLLLNNNDISVAFACGTTTQEGLLIWGANAIITNVTSSRNCVNGIRMYYATNGILTNIGASANGGDGISTFIPGDSGTRSYNNTITSANASYNDDNGIYLSHSTNNTLTNLTANSNTHYGVYLSSSSGNTLTNTTATGNLEGIDFTSSTGNLIQGGNISSNSYGLVFDSSSSNTINDSRIQYNGNGIFLTWDASCPKYNTFYNNYIYNTVNAHFDDSCELNYWNITKSLGANIAGGSWIGGNYWATYTGTDQNGDGIGDTAYSLATNNTDYLPLIVNNYSTVSVVVNSTGFRNYTFSMAAGNNETFNVTAAGLGGNVNVSADFSITGNLSNASLFTVYFQEDPMNLYPSESSNMLITIHANSTAPTGNYTGWINWSNQNMTSNNGSILVTAYVSNLAADIKFVNSSFSAAFDTGSTVTRSFAFWNKGTYNASICQISYSGSFGSISSPSAFTVTNTSNVTATVTFAGSSAGTGDAYLTITCTATAGGGIDSDTIAGSISISAAEVGGGGGGGTTVIVKSGNWSIVKDDFTLVMGPGSVSDNEITLDNRESAKITQLEVSCIPSTCNPANKCSCVNLCKYVTFGGNATALKENKYLLLGYSINPGQRGKIPFTINFTKNYALKNNLAEIGYCTSPYTFSLAVIIDNVTQPASVTVVTVPGSEEVGKFITWIGGSTDVGSNVFNFGSFSIPNWVLIVVGVIAVIIVLALIAKMLKPKRKRKIW